MTIKQRLESFVSLHWYDSFVDLLFRFVAKTAEPLLAVGIVYSAADVLSKGELGGMSPMLLIGWAITQSVAIEASGGVVLVYGLESLKEGDRVKGWAYLALAGLLSLTGAIMLFMQLAGWEQQGNTLFMLCLFGLRCVVSIGYISLCRTKRIRFTGFSKQTVASSANIPLTLEDIRTVVSEIVQAQLIATQPLQIAEHAEIAQDVQPERVIQLRKKAKVATEGSFERVKKYLHDNPNAKVREVGDALQMSPSSAHTWMKKVKEQA